MSDLMPSSMEARLAPSLLISVLLSGLLLAALPARATPLAYGSGLSQPGTVITFDGLAENAAVGASYAAQGVTVSGLFVTRQFGNTLGSTTAPAAANFLADTVNPVFTFSFSSLVSDVAFFLTTDGYGATISSTRGGTTVESVSVGSYRSDGNDFFGFTGSAFDGITVSVAGDGLAVIDNLEFSTLTAVAAVPEPGSLTMLASGVLATGLLAAAGVRRRQAA